ncbi:MAG: hypothetical protein K6F69_09555 [Treponema sp.]|nr:hypothetical protein [Treponema sp.]
MNYIIKFANGTYLNAKGAVTDIEKAFLFKDKLSAKIYLSTTLADKGEIIEVKKLA